jgi:hypothetical protein
MRSSFCVGGEVFVTLTLSDSTVERARAKAVFTETPDRATEWRMEERPNIVELGDVVQYG